MTTILAVKRDGEVAIAGDGQITIGDVVMKHSANKLRTLYHGQVIAGFAGAVADALTLAERFDAQLDKHSGQLRKAAVELAKEWRTDRVLRRLDAWLVAADQTSLLVLSGEGDVIEPDENVVGVGSGGGYAQAAATALAKHTGMSAVDIARIGMGIAADLCIYTNRRISILAIGGENKTAVEVPAEKPE
ncbi:MAG: ATP-dependent protease subunit HslV [Chloroflexi bacterium]|nr:ATP-dependent protease subunit HslV [Chloroflexota bacterium]